MDAEHDPALDELTSAKDAGELWRLLLRSLALSDDEAFD